MMNGQNIIVKLKYEDDFRRATLPVSEIHTYDAMTSWVAETYNLYEESGNTRNLLLKYKDEDGDLITMINDDDLQLALSTTLQQKLFIHVFVNDNAAATAFNNSSRLSSPIKSESQTAVIHPSNHEEQDGRHFNSAASPSSNHEMSSLQQRHPGKPETPKQFDQQSAAYGMPLQHYKQEHHHQSPSSLSNSAVREQLDSSSVTAISPQRQQQQQPPSYPSAATQQFAAPMMNGLPPQQPHHQLQPSLNEMHPPPPHSHQQHYHQQQQQNMPSYPSSAATAQHGAPTPLQQQAPPTYSSQSTNPQSYGPPSSINGLQKQPSFNGMPPPPSSQHHQVQHQQQQMPSYPPPLSAPPTSYGPPPPPTSSALPGLGNPFARQQFQQRPGQR